MAELISLASQNGISMLADHPALEMLNTLSRVDGVLVDSLEGDDDVLQWFTRIGWPIEDDVSGLRPASLLHATRTLREIVRALVERRKTGETGDVTTLNAFLAEAESHLELVPNAGGGLDKRRRWRHRTPEQMLAPLAESAAELLATGDLGLVRQCENEECVLWFYDRTKSHHRRWCSMATCGNRHKVAAFRRRQQAGLQ